MNDFAIVVPVGQYDPRLEIALKSLEVQDVQVEVALMDASNDPRTVALANRFDGILSKRFHQPDRGQADAIGTGWDEVSGRYLRWLNADDALMPGALEKVLSVFESDAAPDVVTGQSTIVDEKGRTTGFHRTAQPASRLLLRGNTLSQPSCFVKREAIESIGGIGRTLHYTMDWDLWMRLYQAGLSFSHLDQPLSCVLMGEDTKTAQFTESRRREIWHLVRRNHSRLTAAKTMTGFMLEHLKAGSASAAKIVTSLFPAADDSICLPEDETLEVPLLNMSPARPQQIIIQWRSCAPDTNIEYSLAGAPVDGTPQSADQARIDVPADLKDAHRIDLGIRCLSGQAKLDWIEIV